MPTQGRGLTDANKQIKIHNVIQQVQKTNDLIRLFDDTVARIGSSNSMLDKVAFPNHLAEIAPILAIDATKEIEILAQKFRV